MDGMDETDVPFNSSLSDSDGITAEGGVGVGEALELSALKLDNADGTYSN